MDWSNLYQMFLRYHGLSDGLYDAMNSNDLSDIVIKAQDILDKTRHIPEVYSKIKTEKESNEHRMKGNKAFKEKIYQKALICYNKALMCAPKDSLAKKLAISNRSALLFKAGCYAACLTDIQTLNSMGCPPDIVDKIRKRQIDANGLLWRERLGVANLTDFAKRYFRLRTHNPDIPCASTHVGVVMESQVPKVIATKDVKVGTVMALEKPFVSDLCSETIIFTCYYCQKVSLNLMPCDGCCFALFCNEKCQKQCFDEYHDFECKIMGILNYACDSFINKLSVRALLKLRHLCSWDELISASYKVGEDRLKSSSINDIYDVNNKFSVLNFVEEKHFIHGLIFNGSFRCAILLHYLDKIPLFFPQSPAEKQSAVRAFARLYLYFILHVTPRSTLTPVFIKSRGQTEIINGPNHAWFSFIGKLKSSCDPNTIAVMLDNKMALIALKPIKRDTELTIAHVSPWLSHVLDKDHKNYYLYLLNGTFCNCTICKEEFIHDYDLTTKQMYDLYDLDIETLKRGVNVDTPHEFHKLCKALASLSNRPFSKLHKTLYTLFHVCLSHFQNAIASNVSLD